MKVKINLLLLAGIALVSFSSCTVFVKGPGHVHHEHMEHHEQGDRDYVLPPNNGTEYSFDTPSTHQPAPQVAFKSFMY